MRLGCHGNVSIFAIINRRLKEKMAQIILLQFMEVFPTSPLLAHDRKKNRVKIRVQPLDHMKSHTLSIHKKLRIQARSIMTCTSERPRSPSANFLLESSLQNNQLPDWYLE